MGVQAERSRAQGNLSGPSPERAGDAQLFAGKRPRVQSKSILKSSPPWITAKFWPSRHVLHLQTAVYTFRVHAIDEVSCILIPT